jgi:outer membrane protein TolC
LGLPVNAKVDVAYPQALKQLEQAGPKDVPLNEDSAIQVALRTRPEVLTQRSEVRDAERDVEIAADAFLPQLDLMIGLSASGTEPRLPHRIRFHEYKRELGVDFNYQLDQTDNRDAYRNAVIDYDKARRDYEQFVDNIRLDVRQSYRQLLRARRSHELSLRALEVAERQRALAALQYKAGQAPARDLLEAEADWLRARNNVSSSLVDYTVTRLSFLADLGLISVTDAGKLAERTDPETFKRISQRYPYAAK